MALPLPLLHVVDEKTTGTNAGTSVAATYNIRDLNTVRVNQISGASLASNQITLPAGTYYIEATDYVLEARHNKLLLWNDTDSAYIIVGMSAWCDNNASTAAQGIVRGQFTLAAEKVLELHHYTTFGFATNGLGPATSDGEPEIYCEVVIWELNGDELPSMNVRDEKASGILAAASVTRAFKVRELNTVKRNTITGASLASDQVTLPAGVYQVFAFAPVYHVGRCFINLYNTTVSNYIAWGHNSFSSTSGDDFGRVQRLAGQFTLFETSVLELRNWTEVARSAGFGQPTSDGEIETYADMVFIRVGDAGVLPLISPSMLLGLTPNDGLKPASWALSSALVDPQWQILHHASSVPRSLVPMWEGAGAPYDYVGRQFTDFADPAWLPTQRGSAADQRGTEPRGVKIRADSSDLEFLKDDTEGMILVVFSLANWTADKVLFSAGQLSNNDNGLNAFTNGTTGEIEFAVKHGATQQWVYTISGLSLNTVYAVVFGSDGSGNFTFVDGAEPSRSFTVGSASSTGWTSGLTVITAWGLGQFAKAVIVHSDHDILTFGHWGAVPSREIARALSADPFGLIRMQ